MRLRLHTRIILATMTLVTVIVLLTGTLFILVLHRTLQSEIGENALDVARTVARMPELRAAMQDRRPSEIIQPLAEQVRAATGASFVVVGNQEGIRYSHPNPANIGLPMVGGDNGPALDGGKEYISIATGTLGTSVRGKVPILDDHGQVMGVVSVGFLLPEVWRLLWTYAPPLLLTLVIGLCIGVPGAVLLARQIKRATHGMEPEEIAALAEQRSAILGAIREGIIAIDRSGSVVVANQTAQELVPGLRPGVPLLHVLPNSRLPEVMVTGEIELDQRMLIGETTVITNRIPLRLGDQVVGGVASFRDQSELERLSRDLTQTQRYAEELRAQAHEFANTLQAISGLLQLGQVEDAVDFIQELSAEHRELVEAMPRSLADPALAALLLGKRARAEELHCQFAVDPASQLVGRLPDATLLVRVVGNLVDNALEAVQSMPLDRRQVRVRLTEEAGQVHLAVADSGPGVPAELAGAVFTEGYSTKGAGRGVGLALVKRLVERVGGRIWVEPAPEGGARFEVRIPRPVEV